MLPVTPYKASRAILDEQDSVSLCAVTTTVTPPSQPQGKLQPFSSPHSPPEDNEIPQRQARTAHSVSSSTPFIQCLLRVGTLGLWFHTPAFFLI